MELEVIPAVGAKERVLLTRALEAAGGDGAPAERRLTSLWWRAGVAEAVEAAEEPETAYALSPRNTRGATRA
jgi:hypothetical protein